MPAVEPGLLEAQHVERPAESGHQPGQLAVAPGGSAPTGEDAGSGWRASPARTRAARRGRAPARRRRTADGGGSRSTRSGRTGRPGTARFRGRPRPGRATPRRPRRRSAPARARRATRRRRSRPGRGARATPRSGPLLPPTSRARGAGVPDCARGRSASRPTRNGCGLRAGPRVAVAGVPSFPISAGHDRQLQASRGPASATGAGAAAWTPPTHLLGFRVARPPTGRSTRNETNGQARPSRRDGARTRHRAGGARPRCDGRRPTAAAAGGSARGGARAADAKRALYLRYCSACHGNLGDGDGPVAKYMTPRPTNLSLIMKKHDDTFPFQGTLKQLDGLDNIRAHGNARGAGVGRELEGPARPDARPSRRGARQGRDDHRVPPVHPGARPDRPAASRRRRSDDRPAATERRLAGAWSR